MSLRHSMPNLFNASEALPWLVTSGQPEPDDLRTARTAGVKNIIDARDPMEPRGYDEPALVRELGMQYELAPVVTGALSDAVMDRVLGALRRHAGTPTVLHCSSANRTGGPLLAYLLLEEKVDEAAAIDIAMRAGLRSVEVMEWALDYAHRHGGAAS